MQRFLIFTNNNFDILSYLYDNMNKDRLVKITQTELAQEMKQSRATINSVFKELKENNFIIHDESRIGRYYLTESAIKLVKTLREIGE